MIAADEPRIAADEPVDNGMILGDGVFMRITLKVCIFNISSWVRKDQIKIISLETRMEMKIIRAGNDLQMSLSATNSFLKGGFKAFLGAKLT